MVKHAAHAALPGKASRRNPSSDVRSGNRRRIWTVLMWVAIALFAASLIYLGVNLYGYWSDSNRYAEIAEEAIDFPDDASLSDMTVDWDALQEINSDVIGWIYVPGTVISYPVVQGKDNEEYLDKNFDGATGLLTGCGTVFMDCENDAELVDDVTFLYGHHRQDGTMFAALSDLADQSAFDECRDIYYLTPDENYHFESFALVRTTGDDRIVQLNFSSGDDCAAYLEDKMDRSLTVPSEGMPDASSIEQTLAMATCDYNEDDGRAILFARLLESVVPSNHASNVVGEYESATE